MAVNQRKSQGEGLGHADQRIVNRPITMWMEFSHHVADDAGALDMRPVWSQTHLGHLEQDASLDWLEAIACIWKGARVDDRVRVLQEGPAHFIGDINVDDALGLGGTRWGRTAGHGGVQNSKTGTDVLRPIIAATINGRGVPTGRVGYLLGHHRDFATLVLCRNRIDPSRRQPIGKQMWHFEMVGRFTSAPSVPLIPTDWRPFIVHCQRRPCI